MPTHLDWMWVGKLFGIVIPDSILHLASKSFTDVSWLPSSCLRMSDSKARVPTADARKQVLQRLHNNPHGYPDKRHEDAHITIIYYSIFVQKPYVTTQRNIATTYI